MRPTLGKKSREYWAKIVNMKRGVFSEGVSRLMLLTLKNTKIGLSLISAYMGRYKAKRTPV
jgi:hypothetical protein